MKLIFGIIVVEERDRLVKEDKVEHKSFLPIAASPKSAASVSFRFLLINKANMTLYLKYSCFLMCFFFLFPCLDMGHPQHSCSLFG